MFCGLESKTGVSPYDDDSLAGQVFFQHRRCFLELHSNEFPDVAHVVSARSWEKRLRRRYDKELGDTWKYSEDISRPSWVRELCRRVTMISDRLPTVVKIRCRTTASPLGFRTRNTVCLDPVGLTILGVL